MFAYHIDPVRQVVVTRVSGRLSPANLADYLGRLMGDAKFNPAHDALIVAMDEAAVPPPGVAAALAPLVRTWSARRHGVHWAFVLPSESARQAADLALAQVRLTAVTSRCFLSESAALAWLETVRAARNPPTPVV